MSEAKSNLQLVEDGFAAFAGDGVEGLISLIADDFVLVTPPSLASEPDTYRGKDGLRRYFDSFGPRQFSFPKRSLAWAAEVARPRPRRSP